MKFKKSPFSIRDKNQRDLNNAIDLTTLIDLMKEQNVLSDDENTVHYRRDLDSLG